MTARDRIVDRYLAARDSAALGLIHKLATKYAHMLGVTELPKIVVRNNLGSRWLGRLIWRHGHENVMEIQESALVDERTLERIVAHEMAHHVEFLEITEEDLARIRIGIRPPEHGARWRELAHQINSTVGDSNFITETSDQAFVQAPETKPYVLLVSPIGSGSLGYAIGVRLSPKMQAYVDKYIANHKARLIKSTDPKWAHGPRIGDGFAMPRDAEGKEKLKALYEAV